MGPVVTRDGRLDTPDHDVMAFFLLWFLNCFFSFDGIGRGQTNYSRFFDKKALIGTKFRHDLLFLFHTYIIMGKNTWMKRDK